MSYKIEGNRFIKASDAKGILYPWELLSTLDNFHEGIVDELPTFLKTWTKVNVRLIHLHLNQQQLRLNILHLIKHLAKVIAVLRYKEQKKKKKEVKSEK